MVPQLPYSCKFFLFSKNHKNHLKSCHFEAIRIQKIVAEQSKTWNNVSHIISQENYFEKKISIFLQHYIHIFHSIRIIHIFTIIIKFLLGSRK